MNACPDPHCTACYLKRRTKRRTQMFWFLIVPLIVVFTAPLWSSGS